MARQTVTAAITAALEDPSVASLCLDSEQEREVLSRHLIAAVEKVEYIDRGRYPTAIDAGTPAYNCVGFEVVGGGSSWTIS